MCISDIIITLIIIQLAKAEWLTFSSIKCLFCSLFIDMTDVYCSKIIMEFDTFQSWYKTYKNTRKNKSDNLVGNAAASGIWGQFAKVLKSVCQNTQWTVLSVAFSQLITADDEYIVK